MVAEGSDTPSAMTIATTKPLSTAQPLQAPLVVRYRPRDGLGLQRKKWQTYIRDAIAYYGVDFNLIFADVPTLAKLKADTHLLDDEQLGEVLARQLQDYHSVGTTVFNIVEPTLILDGAYEEEDLESIEEFKDPISGFTMDRA